MDRAPDWAKTLVLLSLSACAAPLSHGRIYESKEWHIGIRLNVECGGGSGTRVDCDGAAITVRVSTTKLP